MTNETESVQLGMKISGKHAADLQQMADESGQKVTTVARMLLIAAIKQSQEGQATVLPPYLRRFYGDDFIDREQ